MIICTNVTVGGDICGHEMTCIKTGVNVVFSANYAYRGDHYKCPYCENSVVLTGANGYHSPKEFDMSNPENIPSHQFQKENQS